MTYPHRPTNQNPTSISTEPHSVRKMSLRRCQRDHQNYENQCINLLIPYSYLFKQLSSDCSQRLAQEYQIRQQRDTNLLQIHAPPSFLISVQPTEFIQRVEPNSRHNMVDDSTVRLSFLVASFFVVSLCASWYKRDPLVSLTPLRPTTFNAHRLAISSMLFPLSDSLTRFSRTSPLSASSLMAFPCSNMGMIK